MEAGFNQVNGHPGTLELAGPSMARYVEVWPPNSGWRHLEGLLLRAGARGSEFRILAVYPPDWSDRRGALDGAVRILAVACLMGADVMMLGGDGGLLLDPYYPRHVTLTAPERRRMLAWHRFTLSVRDLFRLGEDTSWEEVTGPGGSVEVRTRVPAGPEPGSGLLVRVRRGEGWLAVGLVNLTGSARGQWTEPCGPARPVPASVGALLDDPERYRARVATLGAEATDGMGLRLAATARGTVAWVDLRAVRTFTVVVLSGRGRGYESGAMSLYPMSERCRNSEGRAAAGVAAGPPLGVVAFISHSHSAGLSAVGRRFPHTSTAFPKYRHCGPDSMVHSPRPTSLIGGVCRCRSRRLGPP